MLRNIFACYFLNIFETANAITDNNVGVTAYNTNNCKNPIKVNAPLPIVWMIVTTKNNAKTDNTVIPVTNNKLANPLDDLVDSLLIISYSSSVTS